MTEAIQIQRSRLSWPGLTTEDLGCATDAECCGAPTTCLPDGYTALKVERKRLHLPPGWTLGDETCEYLDLCCEDACSASVYPFYTGSLSCVDGAVPEHLTATVSGDCAAINGDVALRFYVGDDSGDSCAASRYLGQSAAPITATYSITVLCVGGSLVAQVRCSDLLCSSSPDLTIPLTVSATCPFAASGTGTLSPGLCSCVGGGSVTITLAAPATVSGVSCRVLVTRRRIYLPSVVSPLDLGCSVSGDCCDGVIASPCCPAIPETLTATITAASCGCVPLASVLLTYDSLLDLWYGSVSACGSYLCLFLKCFGTDALGLSLLATWSDSPSCSPGCSVSLYHAADVGSTCDPFQVIHAGVTTTKSTCSDMTCPALTLDVTVTV